MPTALVLATSVFLVAAHATPFEANVRLPNGSYQRMTVNADTISNAKAMLESSYCPVKKDCVVSGPHLK